MPVCTSDLFYVHCKALNKIQSTVNLIIYKHFALEQKFDLWYCICHNILNQCVSFFFIMSSIIFFIFKTVLVKKKLQCLSWLSIVFIYFKVFAFLLVKRTGKLLSAVYCYRHFISKTCSGEEWMCAVCVSFFMECEWQVGSSGEYLT